MGADVAVAEQVERAQAGDLQAYGDLVLRFQNAAVGFAFSVLGDFHAAEDAAQDAFLDAMERLGELREPRAFPGWLRRIVFKHCDRIARKRRPVPVPDETLQAQSAKHEVPAAGSGPADVQLEALELRQAVLASVRALPEHERSVTVLFYLHACSQQAISEFVGVPVATVKTRLHAARKRLAPELEGLLRGTFEEHRPSRNANFFERVLQLAHAAYFGDIVRARELLAENPSLATGNFRWFWYWRWQGPGWTPLHRAAEQQHSVLCDVLLDHGADPNAVHGPTGWTPLHMVFGHGIGERRNSLARKLMARGARPDASTAAAMGDLELLERLDRRQPGPDGASALHYAGTREVVEWLLARGLEVNSRCRENGATPIRWALAHGRPRAVIDALIDAGAVLALPDAVALGDAARVAELLAGDPWSARRPLPARALVGAPGATPLHVAANRGHADVAAVLLDAGALPDGFGEWSATPLGQAAFNAQSEAVALLLARGATVDLRDRDLEATPLYWGVWTSALPWIDRGEARDTLLTLARAGASVDAATRDGTTARSLLEERGDLELLDALLEAEARGASR